MRTKAHETINIPHEKVEVVKIGAAEKKAKEARGASPVHLATTHAF